MYRYIALVCDTSGHATSRRARQLAQRLLQRNAEWRCVLGSEQLIVMHAGERRGSSEAHRLDGDAGVILGRLFRRPPNDGAVAPPAKVDAETSEKVITSKGRYLIDHCWGRYVAFIHDRGEGRIYVVHDPNACLPCLVTDWDGITIVFSRPQDCVELGLPPFSVNWDFVAAHVAFQGLHARQSGLTGVSALLGGECMGIGSGTPRRSLYWDPLCLAREDPIENVDDAVAALRMTVRSCVHAWASCYRGILLTLSGGLDSSIVLSCLRDAPSGPSVTCLNYITQEAEGDERLFARQAAQQAGIALVERVRNPATVDLQAMLNVVPSVRPWSYRYSVEHARSEAKLASELGATAVFGGGGGDQLFYQSRAILAVADYVVAHALGKDLWRVAWDAARVEGRSIWSTLRTGIVDGLGRRRWRLSDEVGRFTSLVSPEVIAAVRTSARFLHPWFEDTDGLPYGKHWHLFTMLLPQIFYDPLGQPADPERVKPLVSQPVMETCLRIPTYTLITGGWDRAVARRAFMHDVPRAIITRRTKGALNEHNARLFHYNLPFVRELLLDGLLVQNHLLDRAALERTLSGGQSFLGKQFGEIEDHLSTEIWLRRWSAVPQRAAA